MSKHTRITDVASVLGVAVSTTGVALALRELVDVRWEILVSLGSALFAFVAGWQSKEIAKQAGKIFGRRRVFLSYAAENEKLARQIAEALRGVGAHVWLDQERIRPGENIHAAILRGIESADSFVAVISTRRSAALSEELSLAKERGIRLIPILAEDADIPPELAGIQYVDLRHPSEKALADVVAASTGSPA